MGTIGHPHHHPELGSCQSGIQCLDTHRECFGVNASRPPHFWQVLENLLFDKVDSLRHMTHPAFDGEILVFFRNHR